MNAAFNISEPTARFVCPLPYADVDGEACFYLTLGAHNFSESIALCQEQNGSLATINTAEKNALLIKFLEGKFYSSNNRSESILA